MINNTSQSASLCDSCQRAGKDCDLYDPQQHVRGCQDYREWTRPALKAAQLIHARGHTPHDWSRLCRLIEIEQRLCH